MTPDLIERVEAIFNSNVIFEETSYGTGVIFKSKDAARAVIAIVLEEAEKEAASVSNPFITNREQFSRCMGWTEAQDEIVHAIRALKGDEW